MGRYSEKYWTQGVGIHLPGEDEELYGCEITDSETGLVGSTNRWRSSKINAYDDAWEDLMQKQKDYYAAPKSNYRESTFESSSDSTSSDNSGCITAILWLVGIGVAIFVAVWLAVNVVLPVVLLNSALALVVLALVLKKYKTLFASLALVGGGYMLLDITNGWLSVNFVEKVVKNPDWINAFVYINAAALGLCTWLLVQSIWSKTEQMEPTKKRKSLLLKGALVLLIAITTSLAPIIYHSVHNPFVQKTIRSDKETEHSLEKNIVTDIDGNIYHIVTIGTQVWMVENLKTTRFNDGANIPNITNDKEWENLITPAYCWYNNDISNKNTYGALYNWHAVNTGKLAPNGWHVSSDNEWTILISSLGSEDIASGKLKETGTSHWMSPNTKATNETGFSALPGGHRNYDGTFGGIGNLYGNGLWWSSTESSKSNAWERNVDSSVFRDGYDKKGGLSVRCVKD